MFRRVSLWRSKSACVAEYRPNASQAQSAVATSNDRPQLAPAPIALQPRVAAHERERLITVLIHWARGYNSSCDFRQARES